MATVNVMVALKPHKELQRSAFAAVAEDRSLGSAALPKIAGVNFDKDYGAVMLHARDIPDTPQSAFERRSFSLVADPAQASYLARATLEEEQVSALAADKSVVGVYADVAIEVQTICPGAGPLGDTNSVRQLLCTSALQQAGATGAGVLVAIVDTGINLAHLNAHGINPSLDAARSWAPQAGVAAPGQRPVGHGTMCAYDVCIAAPQCTLLDIALLLSSATGPTAMSGLLSDAVRAYAHLINVMRAPRRPGEARSLVVNNSWGMFHSSWDFPVGHPGNYSHNPNHPFSKIVGDLANEGADILFAAGNCGPQCPDGRCQGVTNAGITGANSHPMVTTVAGVDTSKLRVGYSSVGPGTLTHNKPDICGYTHFAGSGVYAADGGTSAATPVVAGLVAAIRSKRPYLAGNPSRTPAAIRSLITTTATDLGAAGYDLEHGFGVIDGCEIARKLQPVIIDICKTRPWLCRPPFPPIDICKTHPWLCHPIPKPHLPLPQPFPQPMPSPFHKPGPIAASDPSSEHMLMSDPATVAALIQAYQMGLAAQHAEQFAETLPVGKHKTGCGCGCNS